MSLNILKHGQTKSTSGTVIKDNDTMTNIKTLWKHEQQMVRPAAKIF
jgi:hypothetical protein